MTTDIHLIKENTMVYSDSGYAILSPGTPVLVKGVIEDYESEEDIASIVTSDGKEYKMLKEDLIPISSEELNALRNTSIAEDCVRYKKIAQKIKPIPLWAAVVAAIPVVVLRLLKVEDPSLHVLSLAVFAAAALIPSSIYVKYERKGKFIISEDYFDDFSENKKKLESLLEKEEEEEEYVIFEEDIEIERRREEEEE